MTHALTLAPWTAADVQVNARLMAAAPDLLEALSQLVNIVDHPSATRADCRMIAADARAVIKATQDQADR